MDFPNASAAIEAVEQWLVTHKTATLHFLKQTASEKDGYTEISFSELTNHVDTWNSLDSDSLDMMGFKLTSLEDALKAIEALSDLSVSERVKQMVQSDLIHSDKIFASENGKSWIFFSERRVCLIHHSVDWSGLSEYYGKYMNPTRH